MTTRITLVNNTTIDTDQEPENIVDGINATLRDGVIIRIDDTRGRSHWINPATIVEVGTATKPRAIDPNDVLN